MKFDGAVIPIKPRPLGACIDLAICFNRRHFGQILRLTLFFALPAMALTTWMALTTDSGLILSLVLFFFASPVLGAVLVAGIGPYVFGDTLEVGRAFRSFTSRSLEVLPALLTSRVILFMFGLFFYLIHWFLWVLYLPFIGVFLERSFMVAELHLLEQLPATKARSRRTDLRKGASGELCSRWLGTLTFSLLVTFILFLLVDLACKVLLGIEVFFGHFTSSMDYEWVVIAHQLTKPLPIIILQALLWLLYPIARLTHFFCYLDIRIRKECWDLELDYRIEARRLKESA